MLSLHDSYTLYGKFKVQAVQACYKMDNTDPVTSSVQ